LLSTLISRVYQDQWDITLSLASGRSRWDFSRETKE